MDTLPGEIRNGLHPVVFCVNLIHPKATPNPSKSNSTSSNSVTNSNNIDQDTSNDNDLVHAFQNSHQQRFLHPSSIFQDFLKSLSGFQTTLAGLSTSTPSPATDANTKTKTNTNSTPWAHIMEVSKEHAFPPSKDPDGTQNRSTLIAKSRSTSSSTTLYSNASSTTLVPKSYIPPMEGILPKEWLEKHAHALPSVLVVVTYIDITMDRATAEERDLELADTMDQLRSSMASKRECRLHLICCVLSPPTSTPEYDDPFATDDARIHTNNNSNSNSNSNSDTATIDADRFVSLRTKCRLLPSNITTLQLSPNGTTLASLSTPLPYSDPDLDYEPQQQTQNLQQKYIQQQLQLKRLHRTIQDSANSYYLQLARRAKHKLTNLQVDQHQEYLPLAVRYCVKIASFYEFQNRTPGLDTSDKICQFRNQGYQYLEQYYRELVYVMSQGGDVRDMVHHLSSLSSSSSVRHSSSSLRNAIKRESGNDDVEVSLAHSPQPSKSSSSLVSASNTTSSSKQEMKSFSFEDERLPTSASSELFLSDLAHQCRTIASWTNFQIIQMAYQQYHTQTSKHPFVYNPHTPIHPQLLLAQRQWQRYYHHFCYTRSHSWNTDVDVDVDIDYDPLFPKWYQLVHMQQERFLMAQLSECVGLAGEGIVPCCTWKMYEASCDSTMELYQELQRVGMFQQQPQEDSAGQSESDSNAKRLQKAVSNDSLDHHHFVGGFRKEGLEGVHYATLQIDYLDVALDYCRTALSHFQQMESELRGLAEHQQVCAKNRSSANLHFLAGGLLLYKQDYVEAKHHFEQALCQCSKWSGLEYKLLKGIYKCQEHLTLENDTDVHTYASMLLNSSIYKLSSIEEQQAAMDAVFYPSKGTPRKSPLRISLSTSNNNTTTTTTTTTTPATNITDPFTFAATFPQSTHAVAGNTVTASVSLKSNLMIPVSIVALQLQTTVGPVTVDIDPSSNGLIEPNNVLYFTAHIKIPLDMVSSFQEEVVPEVSANLKPTGKPQNIPVGSVGKNIKVRTSGLTQGGGAYYLRKPSDQEIGSVLLDTTFFGGVPISCTGIQLSVAAVNHERHSGSSSIIEIVLMTPERKVVPPQDEVPTKTPTPIKQLPVFEKVNYIDIAWERPIHHSLSLGPRCLRVLKPIPTLNITNITALHTEGRAMEGVVNRIVFQVEAGVNECCSDIEYSINCTNSNILPMPSDDKQGEVERSPILVIHDPSSDIQHTLPDGSSVPKNWKPHPSDKSRGSTETFHKLTSSLEPEKSCLLVLDLFRPSPSYQIAAKADCQTNIELEFRYKQVLTNDGETGGIVTRSFKDSVVWNPPMKAKFSIVQGHLKAYPCGSSHPSNQVSKNSTKAPEREVPVITVDAKSHISANDGDNIIVRCSLEATEAQYGMGTEVQSVSFKEHRVNKDDEAACAVDLVSRKDDNGNRDSNELYSVTPGDSSNLLKAGSKLGLNYTVCIKSNAELSNFYSSGNDKPDPIQTFLGSLDTVWKPIVLPIPDGTIVDEEANEKFSIADIGLVHGPLSSEPPPVLQFQGPQCNIEKTPFHAELSSFPPSPKVATPFEFHYSITNKTPLNQKLVVSMAETSTSNNSGDTSNGILVSGLVAGDMQLGPYESKTLPYSALAMKAGKAPMPALSIISSRYQCWVINDAKNPQFCYVLP